ncbi:heterokaryon incompatibility protein-domain-containing protein [Hypoxylon sp. NC1633]|nr:heterokaryon incompatibility protein-domain-containing protein [Hypoxylon sp. NC1633]
MHPLFWIVKCLLDMDSSWEFVFHQIRITGVYLFLNSIFNVGIILSLYSKSLLDSYFRSNISFYHKHYPASQPHIYRVAFFIVWFILNSLLALLVLSFFAAFMFSFLGLAMGIFVFWCFGLWPSFLVWLLLYRIPVYDIIYPRIRQWMLQHNSASYHRLPPTADTFISYIRLVRIKPGSSWHVIDCELITENIATAEFIALSYVWGTTMFPHRIKVDGNNFYVTYNLFSALRKLRHPDRDRVVWIDAICINQSDNLEKSHQVRLMRTIYSKASEVIVWLGTGSFMEWLNTGPIIMWPGTGSEATADAFNLVRQFGNTRTEEERKRLWAKTKSSWSWQITRMAFDSILSHEWWTRAWIVQEVAVARRVLVQRGSEQLDWDTFQSLCKDVRFQKLFRFHSSMGFASHVEQLRNELFSDNATPTTLFELVYTFRHQFATWGSDKIYAVLGLLPPSCSTTLSPDYSKSPEQVFLDFTLASLAENKTFAVVALAPGAAIRGTSWCRDWRIINNEFDFNPRECFSMYDLPSMRNYCTTGSSEPRVEADISKRVLKVKGFDLDVVAKRGEHIFRPTLPLWRYWSNILMDWERVAGGPWSSSSDEGLASFESFNRTIVADRWAGGIVDWREETEALDAQLSTGPEEESYAMAVTCAGSNRRFFVTQKGRFGLGPWNLKAGDALVAVLGSVVPLVLRQRDDGKGKRHIKFLEGYKSSKKFGSTGGMESEEGFWKVIGEAYCDGLMYYEGDIAKDIRDGNVKVKDYNLR